jgi:hypothetical protein
MLFRVRHPGTAPKSRTANATALAGRSRSGGQANQLRGGNIAPTDFGLSAFAMFFMQSASFLAYQRTMEKGHGRANCRTLFCIGRIPSERSTIPSLSTPQ